ncbi:small ribosomal subunit Rsm22 family protein [Oryzibacter oryziterrae]|uniref:small ribosomal subunit Rsm22 family protein n=1 Tax=Oryzibacter oryziterrae TaxID=2766474 RepID=UPI001F3E7800|nr:small ribosomal subunit Rsm22 family protein [Oryzibacter oryziterrae]
MDVRLPADLRSAIDAAADGLGQSALAEDARRLSLGYREGQPSSRFVRKREDALAYALSRMPATYAAVTAVLGRLVDARPDFRPRTLLDVGAGPGTASWAALELWPDIDLAAMIENNRDFIRLARDLGLGAPHVALREAEIRAEDLADLRQVFGAYDLTIVSYALTELELPVAQRLIGELLRSTRGYLVLVEPGTTRDHGRLMALRQAAIAAGASVVAPCLHAEPCPLGGGDWCHFTVRLPRSRAHMRLKAATVPFEDEPYSYLVLAPAGAATQSQGGEVGRVLKPPRLGKAAIVFDVCAADGRQRSVEVPSRDKPAFKAAKKTGWGDVLSPARDID